MSVYIVLFVVFESYNINKSFYYDNVLFSSRAVHVQGSVTTTTLHLEQSRTFCHDGWILCFGSDGGTFKSSFMIVCLCVLYKNNNNTETNEGINILPAIYSINISLHRSQKQNQPAALCNC